jgi:hypothetical protein
MADRVGDEPSLAKHETKESEKSQIRVLEWEIAYI